MSRYLLVPEVKGEEEDKVVLIPMEGITEPNKLVILPARLAISPPPVMNSTFGRTLLIRLAKTNIGRSKDGLVTVGKRIMKINFDEAVADICKGRFSEKYEDFYTILRQQGITF